MTRARSFWSLLGVLLVPSPSLAEDLIVFHDGTRRSGELRACAGGRCSLGGQTLAQTEIAWVGFAAAPGAMLPASPQTATDAVILRDGRIAAETIVGVSLGSVATEESEFERADVAWICFDCARSPTAPPVDSRALSPEPTPGAAPKTAAAASTTPSATPPKTPESGLPGVPDDRPPSPPPPPRPQGTPTVLLNEVLYLPTAAAAQFVELRNTMPTKVPLEGFSLVNQAGVEVALPASAAVDANGILLVRFDGGKGVEGAIVHSDAPSFLPASGWVALRKGNQELDRVAWGDGEPGGVRLSRGGIVDDPAPGSTLGRLPRSVASSTREWVLYEPAEASPGAPNAHPAVTILLPPDGASVPPPTVTLHWYPVPGAARYRVQVATAGDLGTPLVERTIEQPPLILTLEGGSYFWRVQALTAQGDAAPFSPVASLKVTPRANLARITAAARGFVPAAAAAADAVPDILDVPMIKQHKDTRMLQLEDHKETATHAWDNDHGDLDTRDPADNMNCATASIAMMNAFYGGRLSQDRISYEVHRGRAPGPQWDLNWGLGFKLDEITQGLAFALGATPTLEVPSDALFASALLGVRMQAGIPILVGLRTPHAVVVSGLLASPTGPNEVVVNDPWVGKYVAPESLITGARYWWSLADQVDGVGARPAAARSDEPELSADSDGDGLVDFDEIQRFRTHPQLKDSDQDGVNDKQDIRASVMDERHGYALGGRGRDYDGDGKAMELDSDSDNGGCLDGLEDGNRNGKFESGAGGSETDNFGFADDGCWTGSFELVLEKKDVYEDGDWIHQRHRTYGQFSLGAARDGKLQGSAQLTAALWGLAHNPDCPGSYRYDFEWTAQLEGEVQVQADGRRLVGFRATPESGPDFLFNWITSCPAEPSRFDGVSFPGWGASFEAGATEVDERIDMPIGGDPAFIEFFTRYQMRAIGLESAR